MSYKTNPTYQLLAPYYNPTHGLELELGQNQGYRRNENGVVFLAIALFLADLAKQPLNLLEWGEEIDRLLTSMEVKKGLFNRGATEPLTNRRSISHDNLSAISALSYYYKTNHAKDVAKYGLNHFFIYNNNDELRLPMNPGNYSPWLALGGYNYFLQLLFLPIFIINLIITMSKPKEDTSGKQLAFIELYPLRNKFIWKTIYAIYLKWMVKKYQTNTPFLSLCSIYYRDISHPTRTIAEKVIL